MQSVDYRLQDEIRFTLSPVSFFMFGTSALRARVVGGTTRWREQSDSPSDAILHDKTRECRNHI